MKKICRDIIGVLVLGVMIGACPSPLLEEDELLSALNMQKAAVRSASAVIDLCAGVDARASTVEVDGSDHLIIRDPAGLAAIRDDMTAHYILCNDINLDDRFTQINSNPDTDAPISSEDEFTGTLEGNYKTISGLILIRSSSSFVGLFGKIGHGGEVRNLHVSLADGSANIPSISGNAYVGVLAGQNKGTITRVGVTDGYVTGTNRIGGLVGSNNGEITHSYATASVEGDYSVGGLIGINDNGGTITDSYATGTAEGNTDVGGLVGYNKGTITESYATGTVEGVRIVGGLVGYNKGTITESYATDSVEGDDRVGGLIGINDSGGTITASYATGTVEGNIEGVVAIGGLVGYNKGTITESYATGSVEGNTERSFYVGGLVGYNSDTGTTEANYFDAATTGQSQLIGNESMDARDYHTNPADAYVYTEVAGAGALIAQDNFPDWDFTDIWDWQENGQWPLLQFQGGNSNNAMSSGNDDSVDADSNTLGLCEDLGASATSVEVNGNDYLIIRGQAGLEAIKDDMTAHYILCDNISLTYTFTQINTDSGADNDPSTFEGDEFTGTLEGNHRTIHGLKIHAASSNFVGLFGKIGSGGEIKNLRISLIEGDATNPSITGKRHVGVLAGESEGTITNVKIAGGYVKGEERNIGGLVGRNDGEVKQSYATSNVEGAGAVGGLVGWSEGGSIETSSATGSVEGEQYIGGLVGTNGGTITESYATGSVEASRKGVGGLVGYNYGGTVEASYATGSVEGTVADSSRIGGLVGTNSSAGTITASYATGSVEGTDGSYRVGGLVGSNAGTIGVSYASGAVEGTDGSHRIGGLVGYNNGSTGTITASYFDAVTTGQSQLIGNESMDDRDYHTNPADDYVYTEAAGTGALIAQDNFSNWDFTDIWAWQENGRWPLLQFQDTRDDDSETSYADSDIPAPLGLCVGVDSSATTLEVDGTDHLIIRDQAGLAAIGDDQNSLEAHYILCNDISLEGTFTQINPDTNDATAATFEGDRFSGTLEGNGRTISGLALTRSSSSYVGLFGAISTSGRVRNLYLSLVEGDATNPSITGKRHVGVLAGENKGIIKNVRVTGGYVKGEERNIGGLVGRNDGEVKQSYATSNVEGAGAVGGLVGWSEGGSIETSSATGSVEGEQYIGGLVGTNGGTITESSATGSVEASRKGVGGLVGYNYGGTVEASYATGSVEGTVADSSRIGGLVGTNSSAGTITASYATGSVEGTDGSYRVGGLVGSNAGTIGVSYASGAVEGTDGSHRIGGLVGYNNGSTGTVTDSYFDAITTGQRSSAQSATPYYMYYDNARVYTAAYGRGSMITQSNFSSWDFDTVWAWRGEGIWPLLQFQDINSDDFEGDEFIKSNPMWNQPYDETVFKTSHNSYTKGLIAQLDDGIRGIEFDIWDWDFEGHGQRYAIGHWWPGESVHGDHDDDSSTSALDAGRFSDWLDVVNEWSDENQGHAPLTITLDLKSNMTNNSGFEGGNYASLNHVLLNAFGSKLYTADTLRTGVWPTVGELRDKVIVVLSSAQNSNREEYVWQKGKAPAIAMNDSGQIIVIHESRDTNNLWYWTGQLQSNGLIHWKQHELFDIGKNPAIALNNDGYYVEVHKESGDSNNLYYNSGRLESSDFLLEPDNIYGTKYDTGYTPAIALNDDELFVEVHRGNNDRLYYKTGRLLANTSTNTLEFLASGRYADGVEPGVRFTHLSERTVEVGHRDTDSRDVRASGVVGEDYSIAFSSLEVATDLVASKDTALSDAGHIRAEVSDTYLEYQHIDQEAYSLALSDRQIGWRQVAFVEADRRGRSSHHPEVLGLLEYSEGISYARFFASSNFSKTVFFRRQGYITRDWAYSEDDKQDSLDELPQFPAADAPLPDWYHGMFDELGYVE